VTAKLAPERPIGQLLLGFQRLPHRDKKVPQYKIDALNACVDSHRRRTIGNLSTEPFKRACPTPCSMTSIAVANTCTDRRVFRVLGHVEDSDSAMIVDRLEG
jgi:hypothetical protein